MLKEKVAQTWRIEAERVMSGFLSLEMEERVWMRGGDDELLSSLMSLCACGLWLSLSVPWGVCACARVHVYTRKCVAFL